MLEGLHLSDGLFYVAPDRWGHDFNCLNNTVRVDDKSATHLHPCIRIVNTIDAAHITSRICAHLPRNTPFHHFDQFVVVPHFVHIHTVHTD